MPPVPWFQRIGLYNNLVDYATIISSWFWLMSFAPFKRVKLMVSFHLLTASHLLLGMKWLIMIWILNSHTHLSYLSMWLCSATCLRNIYTPSSPFFFPSKKKLPCVIPFFLLHFLRLFVVDFLLLKLNMLHI